MHKSMEKNAVVAEESMNTLDLSKWGFVEALSGKQSVLSGCLFLW